MLRAEDDLAQATHQTAAVTTLDDLVARVLERKGSVRLSGLRGAARAVAAAHLVRGHGERPVLVLVPGAKDGEKP